MESVQDTTYFEPKGIEKALDVIERDDLEQFELEFKEKIEISHDTYKFIFKLPKED